MEPVGVKEPVDGSYSSAPARGLWNPKPPGEPPVIRTWPLASSVAVCWARGVPIPPVGLNPPPDWAAQTSQKIARNTIVKSMLLLMTESDGRIGFRRPPGWRHGRRDCDRPKRHDYASKRDRIAGSNSEQQRRERTTHCERCASANRDAGQHPLQALPEYQIDDV